MATHEFELVDYDFIELNKLMKIMGLVGTGGEANMRIVGQEVKVNGVLEIQKRKKLRPGDRVEFMGEVVVVR
jgi:ribosome-associated protein